MRQLRRDYYEFVKRNAKVIVIGPEDEAASARYWEKESPSFVGLPDPRHTVLGLYGQEINLLKLRCMPAQVIVDRTGQEHHVHYGHSMSDIPPSQELLALLDELNQASSKPVKSAGSRQGALSEDSEDLG